MIETELLGENYAPSLSHVRFLVTPWAIVLLCPWNFPSKNTRIGSHFLLQRIFLTQELNPRLLCLLHWQTDSLPLHHTVKRWRQWHPTLVLLPGNGWRSLVGCNPWGREESDTTERLPFHFSLSRIGEGNGNPLQCSCLENPRDGGAWWAAVCGVAQSWTRRKRLSSSSSIL